MCYWRRLSKRSVRHSFNGTAATTTGLIAGHAGNSSTWLEDDDGHYEDEQIGGLLSYEDLSKTTTTTTTTSTEAPTPVARGTRRRVGRTGRKLKMGDSAQTPTPKPVPSENPSDRINLFQALEVLQERSTEPAPPATSLASYSRAHNDKLSDLYDASGGLAAINQLMCYQRVEIFAFLFTVASILLAAVSVTIGCYCRASSLKRQSMTGSAARATSHHQMHASDATTTKMRHHHHHQGLAQKPPRAHHQLANSLGLASKSANLYYSPISPVSSSASSPPSSPGSGGGARGGGSRSQLLLLSEASNRSSSCSSAHSSTTTTTTPSDTRPHVYGHICSPLGASNKGDNLARHNPPRDGPLNSLAVFLNQKQQQLQQQQHGAQLVRSGNVTNEPPRLLAVKGQPRRN